MASLSRNEETNGFETDSLIDPQLLIGLTENERKEALAAAAAAKRAEHRAEQRALQRAMEQKEKERRQNSSNHITNTSSKAASLLLSEMSSHNTKHVIIEDSTTPITHDRVRFVSKRQRNSEQQHHNVESVSNERPEPNYSESNKLAKQNQKSFIPDQKRNNYPMNNRNQNFHSTSSGVVDNHVSSSTTTTSSFLSENELKAIKKKYLGTTALVDGNDKDDDEDHQRRKNQQKTINKKITFKFRWDETDDTFQDDDPLYGTMIPSHHNSHSHVNNNNKRYQNSNHQNDNYHRSTSHNLHNDQNRQILDVPHHAYKKKKNIDNILFGDVSTIDSVKTKPLQQMTVRDWRIFRENYEIVVKGGKAPPPIRTFLESSIPDQVPSLHPVLLHSVQHIFQFKEPSPIQRQAIPIGLLRRDLIGIAETGSGKTIAFAIPLCHYILNLPARVLSNVAESGPLAIVMAPTRELALQIDQEIKKLLSSQTTIMKQQGGNKSNNSKQNIIIRTCPVVGGQNMQRQAQELRSGVHILVGTPGRINECIDMAYLVLNQCCYIVLDEADRMIDMGFAPQMESILEATGGLLKSENEIEAYQQEQEDLTRGDVAKHRLTAMFSATMPLEVERMAKRYLRHPAIISIGDQDSGKNARIVQKLVWVTSSAKKEDALRTLLRDPRFIREKVIVFVNEKRHADNVGRIVERSGRQCVVLHGGKSQEQREESLELFRKGGIVMVATDVAGRGLDIQDVAHIINYDLPTRSIESYTHRIGRTGRAGKEGYATSLISDEDEGIMAQLRAYLESTGNEVPDRLAKHARTQGTSTSIMY